MVCTVPDDCQQEMRRGGAHTLTTVSTGKEMPHAIDPTRFSSALDLQNFSWSYKKRWAREGVPPPPSAPPKT